jgi:hypothetical protein
VKIIITEMKITRGFQKHICAGRKKNQQSWDRMNETVKTEEHKILKKSDQTQEICGVPVSSPI